MPRFHVAAAFCLVLGACGASGGGGGGGDPAGAASLLRVGDSMLEAGDAASAATFYAGAAARNPGDPEAALRLAGLQAAAGDAAAAEATYRRALAAAPADTRARTGLASMLLRRGAAQDASALLDEIPPRSRDARAWRLADVAHDLSGRPQNAVAAYREGLARASGDPDLRANLGLSLALAGEEEAALREAAAAANAPGAAPRHRRNLALVLALAGRNAEALGLVPGEEGQDLLARAQRARAAPDPAARATALGLVAAGAPAAPARQGESTGLLAPVAAAGSR